MARFLVTSLLLLIGYALPVLSEKIPLPEKRTADIPLPERRPAIDPIEEPVEQKQSDALVEKKTPDIIKTAKPAKDTNTPDELNPDKVNAKAEAAEEEEDKTTAQTDIPLPVRHPERNTLGNTELTIWPAMDILKAQQFCDITLKGVPVTYDLTSPIRKGRCGTPAPIKLKSVGENPVVAVKPAASINCQMAKALNVWMEKKVQPAAKKYLNTSIVTIRNIASYSCRHRYNNPKKRISEHAFANAIDIAALITKDGQKIVLLKHWGPTERDVIAARKAEQKRLLALEEEKKQQQERPSGKILKVKSNTNKDGDKPVQVTLDKRQAENEPVAEKQELPVPLPVSRSTYLQTAELDKKAQFLRAIHDQACGIFGTVLGPESNDAHRNHFHFDLAPRKYGPYCE